MHHALASLLVPRSVALIGASERPGSLGRTVYENLVDGTYQGQVHAVNPKRRDLLGRPVLPSLAEITDPVDLAVIATPAPTIPGILERAGGKMRMAVILSYPEGDDALARSWERDVMAVARGQGIRLLGPGAFGIVRTDIGLNATFCAPLARPGRLALVAQSGAVCTAMLDFAAPHDIGFSTVASIGGGIDLGFGEILEALVHDPATDGILLYVETVGDARVFMSALRMAARTKPVVVLKAGRSQERMPPIDAVGEPSIFPDRVFDAALDRAGTVRVRTYTQLFAAARILSMGRIPQGDRLAIVANGRGPGMLAADSAVTAGVRLAELGEDTQRALDAILPKQMLRANPVDVRGDAPPARFADAVSTVLSDPNVDAVVALHVPRPIIRDVEAAQAVGAVARDASKPVLGAWLGALERPLVKEALDAGHVANFYSPENAVDAFSFLAAYRRNQQWLLEVSPSQPDPSPPDLAAAEDIRRGAKDSLLLPDDVCRLLGAFGIESAPTFTARTLTQAKAAARQVGYPVTLTLETNEGPIERAGLAHGRALERAWRDIASLRPAGTTARVAVQRSAPASVAGACAITIAMDDTFGPIISAGPSMRGVAAPRARSVMLPPLSRRLAADLLRAADIAPHDALVALLLRVSAIACMLPWVRALALDPVVVAGDRLQIASARVAVDARREPAPGYRHMAIHPYPVELEGALTLGDGTVLALRPVRPEDAEIERRFVAGLSEETRYYRFFYRLHELTPAMIGRFTQVDYDRELALLALAPDAESPGGQAIVGVARYIANLDHETAEFAVVVTDAWQKRGVAWRLMKALIECARRKGLRALHGVVLRSNQSMLRFVRGLGFVVREDPGDPDQVEAVLDLTATSKGDST
ncbi:MAG: GNAT family N-acetyltransferase [Burkholderiales bacterium]